MGVVVSTSVSGCGCDGDVTGLSLEPATRASSTKAKAKVHSKAARADPTSHLARVCVVGVWLCCVGAVASKSRGGKSDGAQTKRRKTGQ